MRRVTAVLALSLIFLAASVMPAGAVDHEHDLFNRIWGKASCIFNSLLGDFAELSGCFK